MLQRILLIDERPNHYDATDALAVAICHHFQSNIIFKKNGIERKTTKKESDWEEFIRQNPARVR